MTQEKEQIGPVGSMAGSTLRKKDVRSMEIIVRHFAKLERLERQWVIDRLQDDHFHKLPTNLPPHLLRSNVRDQRRPAPDSNPT